MLKPLRTVSLAAGAMALMLGAWSALKAQDAHPEAEMALCKAKFAQLGRILESGRVTDMNKIGPATDEFDEAREAIEDNEVDECIDALEEAFEHLGVPFEGPDPEEVRAAAKAAGASGVTISGAGPTVMAVIGPGGHGDDIARAMCKAFRDAGLDCDARIARPAG